MEVSESGISLKEMNIHSRPGCSYNDEFLNKRPKANT